MTTIVLSQSKFSDCTRKSCSAGCHEFLNKASKDIHVKQIFILALVKFKRYLEFSQHSDKSHCYSVDMGTVFIYGSILKIALLHNVVCSEAIVLKVSTYTHLLEHRCLKILCINCPTFS